MNVFAIILGVLFCVVVGGMADTKIPVEQPKSGSQAYFPLPLPRLEIPDRKVRDVRYTLPPDCAANQICMYVLFNRDTHEYVDNEILCTCMEGLDCQIARFDPENYRYVARCDIPITSRTKAPQSTSNRPGVTSDIHPEERVGQLLTTQEL